MPLKPDHHFLNIVSFITNTVSFLHKIDVQTLRGFHVVAICRSKGTDAIYVVEKQMKFRYVKMFTNFELNNNFFVSVKGVQA